MLVEEVKQLCFTFLLILLLFLMLVYLQCKLSYHHQGEVNQYRALLCNYIQLLLVLVVLLLASLLGDTDGLLSVIVMLPVSRPRVQYAWLLV